MKPCVYGFDSTGVGGWCVTHKRWLCDQGEKRMGAEQLVSEGLDMPEGLDEKGLDEKGRRAHEIIVAYLAEHGRTEAGGCKVFHAPSTWNQEYGGRSHLVVDHRGGPLGPVFSMDAAYDLDCAYYRKTGKTREPYALYEGMQNRLREAGLYFEDCTRWYSAVYSVDSSASDEEESA